MKLLSPLLAFVVLSTTTLVASAQPGPDRDRDRPSSIATPLKQLGHDVHELIASAKSDFPRQQGRPEEERFVRSIENLEAQVRRMKSEYENGERDGVRRRFEEVEAAWREVSLNAKRVEPGRGTSSLLRSVKDDMMETSQALSRGVRERTGPPGPPPYVDRRR